MQGKGERDGRGRGRYYTARNFKAQNFHEWLSSYKNKELISEVVGLENGKEFEEERGEKHNGE